MFPGSSFAEGFWGDVSQAGLPKVFRRKDCSQEVLSRKDSQEVFSQKDFGEMLVKQDFRQSFGERMFQEVFSRKDFGEILLQQDF